MTPFVYLLIAIGVLLSAGAQVVLKKASNFGIHDITYYLMMFLAICLYGGSFVLYSFILKNNNLSKISPIMTVSTSAIAIVAAIVYFNESLTTVQTTGLLLGAVAIFMIAK